ncbi:hypothetical protein ACFQJD_06380 [Haloplanus sp. GCM10025708]|uniref:hypothetical protein n=1 Tax=Haloferacaceae TaxID=1644056 RepID=UPI00360C1B12
MSAFLGDVDAEKQPPMTIPLRHFVVGVGLAVLGGGVAFLPESSALAHVHLLLAGWICVTIMGAMTQFVPVWSGTTLHSRRLATAQLALVTGGLLGFVASVQAGALRWTLPFGLLMAAGFWAFVYNVARTLPRGGLDATERHFAIALGFFLVVPALGVLLAADLATPLLPRWGLARPAVRAAHVTLAVFGAVLTTVLGALYQLGGMFTQSERGRVDDALCRVETATYPTGVAVLAGGRLIGHAAVARVGAAALLVGLAAFLAFFARRLVGARVDPSPVLRRYAVAAVAFALWTVATAPAWLSAPLAPSSLFGAPGTAHLLLFGGVGFVVLGTLYHVVPFIVWVHRYSDQLGFERVPLVDDLYDDRLARADLVACVVGVGGLVGGDLVGLPTTLPGGVAVVGFALFGANVVSVLENHGPHSLSELVLGATFRRLVGGLR